MPCRVTYFFTMGQWGWSESVDNSGNDQFVVTQPARILRDARAKMLPPSCKMNYIRISKIDNVRDSVLINETPSGTSSAFVPSADPAFTAALVRLFASPTSKRAIYMRPCGLGEGIDGDRVVDDSAWLNGFRTWASALADSASGWVVRSKVTDPGGLTVTSVINQLGGLEITVPGNTVSVGDTVTLRKFQSTPNINGLWTVKTVAASIITMSKHPNPSVDVIVDAWGLMSPTVISFNPIISASVIRVTSRKTGRPFASPVGRRRRAK